MGGVVCHCPVVAAQFGLAARPVPRLPIPSSGPSREQMLSSLVVRTAVDTDGGSCLQWSGARLCGVESMLSQVNRLHHRAPHNSEPQSSTHTVRLASLFFVAYKIKSLSSTLRDASGCLGGRPLL